MVSLLQPVRILIIDDDENDFFIISEFIKGITGRSFTIEWTYDYEDALKRICAGSYDLYFADYLLGGKTGLDLLREVAAKHCDQPIILLTGIDNREVDIKAMMQGAVDYLVKSEINTEKLERCIRYSLERHSYMKALKANEHKFHGIFENSKDAIFLADENLFFKEVNGAASELFKFSREELLHLSVYSLFVTPQAASGLQEQVEERGFAENIEADLFTKHQEKKSCILSVSKEHYPDGTPYVQGIIRDITNLKKMEKAAAQIEKLKSTEKLLRTLAHEVRNPLTTINLSLEHLKTELSGQEGETFVDIIDRNLKRIDLLVTELLNSARPGEIVTEDIVLQAILNRAVETASDRISLKRIALEQNFPQEPVRLLADAEKLKIAFLNIIVNAVEAVDAGTGKLSISIKEYPFQYKVFLQDNGCGISEENLSRVFDPYFTSKPNGFGLGLAATLNILRLHHAFLEVQSEKGQGSTFIISFNKK